MPSEQQLKADRVAYLIIASYNGEMAEIKRLLAKDTDVNAANERGVTPLIAATAGCQLSVVEFFLSLGADPSKPMRASTLSTSHFITTMLE